MFQNIKRNLFGGDSADTLAGDWTSWGVQAAGLCKYMKKGFYISLINVCLLYSPIFCVHSLRVCMHASN